MDKNPPKFRKPDATQNMMIPAGKLVQARLLVDLIAMMVPQIPDGWDIAAVVVVTVSDLESPTPDMSVQQQLVEQFDNPDDTKKLGEAIADALQTSETTGSRSYLVPANKRRDKLN